MVTVGQSKNNASNATGDHECGGVSSGLQDAL